MHNITSFINTFKSYELESATEVLDHYIIKILDYSNNEDLKIVTELPDTKEFFCPLLLL